MSKWWYLLLGIVASAPAWVLLTLWAGRRLWRNARRLAARSRGQQHFAEIGQLTAGLAHEIKNPLSTIHINLKLLAEDLAHHDDELHRRWLRRLEGARQEAGRLRDILDDFLRYAGKHELQCEVADLRGVVQELLDFFAPQAEAARVVLRASLPEDPVRCSVDVNLLKQAVLNLLLNAVQAMPAGGELLVRLSGDRGRAGIEVIDTGPGIAPETLPRIFHAYFSTKKGGSGLGLPTTQRIVREHGGAITVESDLGKGTRFVITLPLAGKPETAK